MLVSRIKAKFKVYSDEMSFNLKNSQLNEIIGKANLAYFESLASKWGVDAKNQIEIAPIVKTINLANPSSNEIPYSSMPNYDRIGFVRPTYVENGVTYSFPAKPLPENLKYSPFSNGTVRYPRYWLKDDALVLEPSNTPTAFFATYLREPYTIDFTIADYDVPITDENVENILQIALQNMAVSQREFDMAQQVIVEKQFNAQ